MLLVNSSQGLSLLEFSLDQHSFPFHHPFRHLLSFRANLSWMNMNFFNQNLCMPSWPKFSKLVLSWELLLVQVYVHLSKSSPCKSFFMLFIHLVLLLCSFCSHIIIIVIMIIILCLLVCLFVCLLCLLRYLHFFSHQPLKKYIFTKVYEMWKSPGSGWDGKKA